MESVASISTFLHTSGAGTCVLRLSIRSKPRAGVRSDGLTTLVGGCLRSSQRLTSPSSEAFSAWETRGAGNAAVALNTVQHITEIFALWFLSERCSSRVLVMLVFCNTSCSYGTGAKPSITTVVVARRSVVTSKGILGSSSRSNTVVSRGGRKCFVGIGSLTGVMVLVRFIQCASSCSTGSSYAGVPTFVRIMVFAFLAVEFGFLFRSVLLALVTVCITFSRLFQRR